MAIRKLLLYCIIVACSQLCARAAVPATNQPDLLERAVLEELKRAE